MTRNNLHRQTIYKPNETNPDQQGCNANDHKLQYEEVAADLQAIV